MEAVETTTHICYHPHATRYFPCAQVEKCGECGAVRFAAEKGLWAPTTRHVSLLAIPNPDHREHEHDSDDAGRRGHSPGEPEDEARKSDAYESLADVTHSSD